jgi:hypothetical protein
MQGGLPQRTLCAFVLNFVLLPSAQASAAAYLSVKPSRSLFNPATAESVSVAGSS